MDDLITYLKSLEGWYPRIKSAGTLKIPCRPRYGIGWSKSRNSSRFQANRSGPKSPHARSSSLAAVSPVSVCVGRQSTTFDNSDQGAGRKVIDPSVAELIIEDQPKPIIQMNGLEPLCSVHQEPASMPAAPASGLMHLALGAPKAGPRLPKRDRLHQINRGDESRPIGAHWSAVAPVVIQIGPVAGSHRRRPTDKQELPVSGTRDGDAVYLAVASRGHFSVPCWLFGRRRSGGEFG